VSPFSIFEIPLSTNVVIGVKEVSAKPNLDGAKRSLLHRVIRCW